jgi:phage regulator Rha-like protein
MTAKEKAAGVLATPATASTSEHSQHLPTIRLATAKNEPRVDSRLLAKNIGNLHRSVFELVKDHQADFEEFGKVRFETDQPTGVEGGRPERFALLTEDQAYLLLAYSRNTPRSRALKVRLVKAFGEARRAAVLHSAEYLPTYHQLHDEIQAMAAGSQNERFVHMNINKMVNKVAGVDAGHRKDAAAPQQAMLIVAQSIAAKAVRGAPDHRDGYQRAKSALLALSSVAMLEVCP